MQLLRTLGLASILGNHEAMMLSSEPPKNDEVYQLARCRAMLTDEDFESISQWPAERTLELGGRNVRLMHGSPSDITYGYAYPDSDLDRFACAPGSITVMGNTHRPFWRENAHGAFFLNPGSCGLPRDCGALGSVAILDTGDGTTRILRFDITGTARQALAGCMPVHHSVVALFERPRPSHLVGEIYGP